MIQTTTIGYRSRAMTSPGSCCWSYLGHLAIIVGTTIALPVQPPPHGHRREESMSINSAIVAARATLLALRGTVRTRVALQPDVVLLTPSLKPIHVIDAAWRLADMPKPVSCVARDHGALLAIDCKSPEDEQGRRFHETRAVAGLEAIKRAIYDDYRVIVPDPLLKLEAGGAAMILRMSEVDTWLRDYDLPELAFSMHPLPVLGQADLEPIAVIGFSSEEYVRSNRPR
jgi:hypothetical protein